MKVAKKPKSEKIGWKLSRTQYLFQSRWFNLRQDTVLLPKGDEITYNYIEHPGSVFIVPVTHYREIILIKSYRYTIDDWCWEIPAGTLGDRPNTPPEQVAAQELEEEIGATFEHLKFLGNFYLSNGLANIKGYFYLATGVNIEKKQELEPGEVINQILLISIDRVKEMITNGTINDADSAFAIFLALGQINSI